MATQYIFPCSCGTSNIVEPTQAGQSITCVGCGVDIELPSLMRIKQLEVADADVDVSKKATESSRSYRQSVLFTTGLSLFLIGGIAAGILFYFYNSFYVERPRMGDESRQGFAKTVENRSLAESFDFWENVIKKEGPGEWEADPYLTGEILSKQFRLFAYIASGVGVLGLLLMVGSFFLKSTPKKRRVRKRTPA